MSEGVTTFDIRFQAVTPGGDPLTLIINVEAQQSSDVSYPMIKRALYYGSRLISSQNGVEFDHSHYEKIRKVVQHLAVYGYAARKERHHPLYDAGNH